MAVTTGKIVEGESEDLLFQGLNVDVKVEIAELVDLATTPEYFNLLAVSNVFGYSVFGLKTGFAFAYTKHLRMAVEDAAKNSVIPFPQKILVDVGRPVSHIQLSADQTIILVAVTGGKLLLFKAAIVAKKAAIGPYKTLDFSNTIIDIRSNPSAYPNQVAVLLSDNSCKLAKMDSGEQSPLGRNNVSAICWSKKGKQIVLGSKTGELTQVTPENVSKNMVPPPPDNDGRSVCSIAWLTNTTWAVGYQKSDDEDGIAFRILEQDKEKNTMFFIPDEDPCFPVFADKRKPLYMLDSWVPSWGSFSNFMTIFSTSSDEAGCVALHNGKWEKICSPEIGEIRLPLGPTGEDTCILGVGLDLTSTDDLPGSTPDAPRIPPIPIFLVYNSAGWCMAYHMFNGEAIKQGLQCEGMVKTLESLPVPTALDVAQHATAPPGSKQPLVVTANNLAILDLKRESLVGTPPIPSSQAMTFGGVKPRPLAVASLFGASIESKEPPKPSVNSFSLPSNAPPALLGSPSLGAGILASKPSGFGEAVFASAFSFEGTPSPKSPFGSSTPAPNPLFGGTPPPKLQAMLPTVAPTTTHMPVFGSTSVFGTASSTFGTAATSVMSMDSSSLSSSVITKPKTTKPSKALFNDTGVAPLKDHSEPQSRKRVSEVVQNESSGAPLANASEAQQPKGEPSQLFFIRSCDNIVQGFATDMNELSKVVKELRSALLVSSKSLANNINSKLLVTSIGDLHILVSEIQKLDDKSLKVKRGIESMKSTIDQCRGEIVDATAKKEQISRLNRLYKDPESNKGFALDVLGPEQMETRERILKKREIVESLEKKAESRLVLFKAGMQHAFGKDINAITDTSARGITRTLQDITQKRLLQEERIENAINQLQKLRFGSTGRSKSRKRPGTFGVFDSDDEEDFSNILPTKSDRNLIYRVRRMQKLQAHLSDSHRSINISKDIVKPINVPVPKVRPLRQVTPQSLPTRKVKTVVSADTPSPVISLFSSFEDSYDAVPSSTQTYAAAAVATPFVDIVSSRPELFTRKEDKSDIFTPKISGSFAVRAPTTSLFKPETLDFSTPLSLSGAKFVEIPFASSTFKSSPAKDMFDAFEKEGPLSLGENLGSESQTQINGSDNEEDIERDREQTQNISFGHEEDFEGGEHQPQNISFDCKKDFRSGGEKTQNTISDDEKLEGSQEGAQNDNSGCDVDKIRAGTKLLPKECPIIGANLFASEAPSSKHPSPAPPHLFGFGGSKFSTLGLFGQSFESPFASGSSNPPKLSPFAVKSLITELDSALLPERNEGQNLVPEYDIESIVFSGPKSLSFGISMEPTKPNAVGFKMYEATENQTESSSELATALTFSTFSKPSNSEKIDHISCGNKSSLPLAVNKEDSVAGPEVARVEIELSENVLLLNSPSKAAQKDDIKELKKKSKMGVSAKNSIAENIVDAPQPRVEVAEFTETFQPTIVRDNSSLKFGVGQKTSESVDEIPMEETEDMMEDERQLNQIVDNSMVESVADVLTDFSGGLTGLGRPETATSNSSPTARGMPGMFSSLAPPGATQAHAISSSALTSSNTSSPFSPGLFGSATNNPSNFGGGGRSHLDDANPFAPPSTPLASKNGFGLNQLPAFVQSTFASSPASPAFGTTSLGVTNSPAFNASVFGQPSSFSEPASAFGSSTPLPSGNRPAFGSSTTPASTVFGSSTPLASGNRPDFGSSTPIASGNRPAFGSSTPLASGGNLAFGSSLPLSAVQNGFSAFSDKNSAGFRSVAGQGNAGFSIFASQSPGFAPLAQNSSVLLAPTTSNFGQPAMFAPTSPGSGFTSKPAPGSAWSMRGAGNDMDDD